MSVFCWSFNGGTIYDTSGTTAVIEFGSDSVNEYNNMEISNPNYGGVLCCQDDELKRVSQRYQRPELCNKLTDEYGCADNECLDTCRYCISDIQWYVLFFFMLFFCDSLFYLRNFQVFCFNQNIIFLVIIMDVKMDGLN